MPDNSLDVSPADRDLWIRTVIGEAGTDPASQPAVAHVIANRIRDTGQSPSQVVLAPNQFEPWNNRARELLSASPNSAPYKTVAKVVDGVITGSIPDPTNGATQFYAPAAQKALGRKPPAWDDGTGVQIGAHKFFGGNPSMAQNASDPEGEALFQSYINPPAKAAAPAPTEDPEGEALFQAHLQPAGQPATPAAPAAKTPMRLALDAQGNTIVEPAPATPGPGGPRDVARIESMQDLSDAAKQVGSYAAGQVGGIPSAIGQSFESGTNLAASGLSDIHQGNYGIGGLKALAGTAGALTAPLTGTIQKTVEEPAYAATGNPQFSQNLGFVANSLAGPAIGRVAGMASNALGNVALGTLDPETAQLAALARDRYGINVNAGQISPNQALRFTSSTLNRLPFSGSGPGMAAQSNAFHEGLAAQIGEHANRLTPDVMNAAETRIGNNFDTVAQNTTLRADQQFQNNLQNTLIDAHHELSPDEFRPLNNIFDNIINKINANGNIDGETYQALTRGRTPLGRAIANPNPNISYYAQQIRDHLDDALQRSAPPDMQDLLTEARGQWRNLKTLEPLAAKSNTGEINPALLKQAINNNPFSKNALAYGRGGDLADLARIGNRFLAEPPSSGTAERLTATGLMGSIAGLAGGAVGLHGISPEMLYPLAVLPAGRVVGGALRSQTLANALINRSLHPWAPGQLSPALAALGGAGAFATLKKPVNGLTAPNQNP